MVESGNNTAGLDDRRKKRLARRQQQSENNLLRAEKMCLTRLAAVAHEPRKELLSSGAPLNVGCSGWYYWGWRECFYPPGSPSKDWFPHYASRFTTVELNAPFYSWPTASTVKTWIRQANGWDFVYSVKVCGLITHTLQFVGTERYIQDFGFIGDLLGSRMGCFLYQLPPSFKYTADRLSSIIAQLEPRRRNVVEFRHRSWWNDEVFAAFRQAGIIFCSCSGPKLPDELIRTADDIYIRFHGTNRWYRHDYSPDELLCWANRIRESGAKRVWAYFNNDHDCYAPKNAHQMLQILGSR